jgi:hypothetical protein
MSEDPCEEVVTSIIGSWREQGIPLNPDWICGRGHEEGNWVVHQFEGGCWLLLREEGQPPS